MNIIGEPNAGKSTLLNTLLGEQLVITDPKAQTTRHRVHGIINGEDHQIILSDTPGILDPAYKLQERMMSMVDEALQDADVLLVLTDVESSPERQDLVIKRAAKFKGPLVVLLNKIDTCDQERLEMRVEEWARFLPEAEILPISALHKGNTELLLPKILQLLPEAPAFFPKDEISDRSVRFFVSEIIRGKILQLFHQEIPYSVEVVVNAYDEAAEPLRIQADIMVMRKSQKGIIIGHEGKMIKELGKRARRDIERFLGQHIYLDLYVKVDPDWRSSDKKLRGYGYGG